MIKNMWYAVLPSKDVKKGKILGVKRFGLDLAFFRDEKGTLSCVMDLCAHRGAALSKGKMDGDCIACPFHGIAFDGKGKANVIPANGRKSTKDLSRFNVKSYPVREEDGIVFVWYGEKEPTEELPYFYDEDLKEMVYSEFCDHWEAHYSRVIENQLDVIHVPIVHHNTIGRGNKTLIHGPLVLETEDKIQTSANNEVDRGQEPKKPKDCEIKSTNLNFKFPNVWLNHISDKIKVLIYFAPVDDENTLLYIRFYNTITPLKPVNKLISSIGSFANKIVERQDRRVVVTQRPSISSLRSGETLLTGDGPIISYRKERDRLQRLGEEGE